MPELPEVETIRRYLATALPGRPIDEVLHLDSRMVKRSPLDGPAIQRLLAGETFLEIEREGKFLLLRVSSGDALLLHLGMSGRLVVESREAQRAPHTHLVVRLGDQDLRLVDPRRFGRIAWVAKGDGLSLGIDPLSPKFTREQLKSRLQGRAVAVKSALLNQSLIAGLGNIYADEALFYSRIHPARPAGLLTDEELGRLVRSIRRVLRISLEHRGTSFSDYVDALGHPGENQQYLMVYGREGKPCPRCRSAIQRRVLGGRSSHYCPRCQGERLRAVPEQQNRGESHAEI